MTDSVEPGSVSLHKSEDGEQGERFMLMMRGGHLAANRPPGFIGQSLDDLTETEAREALAAGQVPHDEIARLFAAARTDFNERERRTA